MSLRKALFAGLGLFGVAALALAPTSHLAYGQASTTTIGALPGATLPLTGSEVVPIWQSGKTVSATAAQIGASAPNAVSGPSSSVSGDLPSFNDTTGKLVQDSGIAAANVVTLAGTQTLANKTLTAPAIATIANTGTLTLPTSTDTLVGRATTDTLSNKTLASPTVTGAFTATGLVTNADLANSSMTLAGHSVSLGATQTFAASDLTNGTTGTGSIVLAASPTFSGTVTFPGSGTASSTGFANLVKVGIGMSPTNILDITQNQNAASRVMLLNNSAGASATPIFEVSNGSAVGEVGIFGTGVPTSGIQQASMTYLTGSGVLGVFTSLAQPLIFGVNSVEAARFNGNGRFLIGATSETFLGGTSRVGIQSPDSQVLGLYQTLNGWGVKIRIDETDAGFAQFIYQGNGVGTIVTNGTSTIYGTSSDERLKNNITDAPDPGSIIDALKVRSWDWKSNGAHEDYGFVAQEEYQVAPFAVIPGDNNPTTITKQWQRDDSKLVPLLVEEIQSLRRRVSALEPKVSTVAALPVCNSSLNGTRAVVNDGSAPAYLQALVGGGSVETGALCNGTAWIAD